MKTQYLGTLSTDATSQLNVTDHDGDTLGMDGAQVDILKEADKVSLSGLLEGSNGSALETQVSLGLLGNLTNEALEGKLADQKLSALLIATDFTESDSSGTIAMGLLDSSRAGGRRLAGSLGGDLLAGCFTSGGLAGSLLGAGHWILFYRWTMRQPPSPRTLYTFRDAGNKLIHASI